MLVLPTLKLFGLPSLALRDFLNEHRGLEDRTGFTYRQFADHFGLTARAAKAILADMAEADYVKTPAAAKEAWQISFQGQRLCQARAVNRISRARAEDLLSAFLERVAQVAAEDRFSHEVDKLWVFGSYARGEPEVGDIDLIVILRWKLDRGSEEVLRQRALRYFKKEGRAAGFWNAEQRATEDKVWHFLKARKRHLSLMSESQLEHMIKAGEPPQLLYEALPSAALRKFRAVRAEKRRN